MSDKTLKELTVDAHIAVLHTKVDALIEKQKEITQRVRANEKVVAAIGLLGTIALAFIGAGALAPRAEACSPHADCSEFTCPSHDGIIDDVFKKSSFENNISEETEAPDYYRDYQTVTVYDTREEDKWNYGTVIQRIREWQSEQGRESVEDMINSSLAEYENGSNDSTEQEELLQFPSNRDS